MRDLKGIIIDLEPYFDLVYRNEDKFLKDMIGGWSEDLMKIAINDTGIEVTYVNAEGAHIFDTVNIDNFIKWIDKNKED